MKKSLIAFLLLALLTVPAFASNNSTDLAGVTVGPAFKWVNSTLNGSSTTNKESTTDITVYVTETSYFGNEDNFGLSLGFGIDKALAYTLNGTKQDQDAVDNIPMNLSMYLYFQYKYDFSNTFALEVGVGPQFDMGTMDKTVDHTTTTKTWIYSWAITAKVNALIHFSDAFALQAGCYLGMPLNYQVRNTVSTIGNPSVSTTYNYKVSGFYLTPFVGAMFSF